METKIIPAILTDTVNHLEEEVAKVEQFVDYIQIDYVDGYFAPEITCCEAKIIREVDILPAFEVHLMVEEPIRQVRDWFKAGAARIVGHIEEMEDQLEFVQLVNKLGLEVGLALNLETALTDLDSSLIPGLNVVLLMAHEVGVQGVKFREEVVPKINELRFRYPNLNIEIDGGMNKESVVIAKNAGANYFAVGSDIIAATDPRVEYDALLEVLK